MGNYKVLETGRAGRDDKNPSGCVSIAPLCALGRRRRLNRKDPGYLSRLTKTSEVQNQRFSRSAVDSISATRPSQRGRATTRFKRSRGRIEIIQFQATAPGVGPFGEERRLLHTLCLKSSVLQTYLRCVTKWFPITPSPPSHSRARDGVFWGHKTFTRHRSTPDLRDQMFSSSIPSFPLHPRPQLGRKKKNLLTFCITF